MIEWTEAELEEMRKADAEIDEHYADKHRAVARAYYWRHREERLAYGREYYQRNRERLNAYALERYRKKRDGGGHGKRA